MSESKQKTDERAKLSLDLDSLDSMPINGPEPAKIEALSEASGFNKREWPKTPQTTSQTPSAPKPKPRKRRTTGRTYPFNTKIKPEAYMLLGSLADELSEAEDRPVSMAEVLERALNYFDAKLNVGDKSG